MSSLTYRILRSPRVRGARATTVKRIRRADAALARPALWLAAVTVLLAFQTALIFTHQPWLDEVQAALIAIQAPDAATMLDWLAYEGHPPLWYFLLRGLGHLVEPLWTLSIAAFLCAIPAQLAILFASPFTRAERLMVAASQFVIFEFFTVSRSITLGSAAMIAVAALWRRRAAWLAIAVLPMCDFLFGVASVMFAAIKWRERDLWWPGVALWVVSGLLAAYSVIPAPDVRPAIDNGAPVRELVFWVLAMGNLLVPWQGMTIPHWNDVPFFLFMAWAGVGFVYLAWTQTRFDRFYQRLLMGLIGLTFVFAIVVYRLAPRHLMIIALMLIILVWFGRLRGERAMPAFRSWLAVAAACGLVFGSLNLVWPFDRSKAIAAEIERMGLRDKHWVTFPVDDSPAISAHSGIDFERAGQRCMQSFVLWNHRSQIGQIDLVEAYFRQEAREHGKGYLLSGLSLAEVPPDVLKLIGFFPRGYAGNPVYLFEIGPGVPERKVATRPCVAGRRPFERLP